MKKLLATLVLSLGVLTSSFAQEAKKEDRKNKSPEQRTEHRLKKLTKKLNLTPEQVLKIKPLLLAQDEERKLNREERKNLKKEGKLSKEERKQHHEEKMKKRETFKNEMKNILNAEQFAKFEKRAKRKNEKRKKRKEKRKHRKEKKHKKNRK